MDVLGVVAGAAAIGLIAYASATRKNKQVKGDHEQHAHHHEDHHPEDSAASFGGTTKKKRRHRRRRKAWR